MPPRTRKRVKKLETDGDSELASGSTVTVASTNKKEGGSVGKRRSKKSGKLALLLEMPTEIFTEIACYMSPEDLLNLARTSAGFRELLMSKSSMRIWKAARMVQGIPACPSDLSEPQYADLLFGKGCSFCFETRTKKTHITLRVRACKSCSEEQIIDVDTLLREKGCCMPAGVPIQSMIPCVCVPVRMRNYFLMERKYIASELKQVFEKVEALSSNPEDLQAYVTDRERITKAIMKSAYHIEEWLDNASKQKEHSKEELVKERVASIEERLRTLGYDDEDFDTHYDEKGWAWKHILNQTRAVSERVWQNIRPQLEETIRIRRAEAGPKFLADRRKTRLLEIREQFLKYFPQLNNLIMGKLLLYADFLELPIVKELMEENDYRMPLTSERWLRITNSLPDALAAFRSMIESHCVEKIKEAVLQASGIDGFNDDKLIWERDAEEDQDRIPTCLLAATALFRRGNQCYNKTLDAYTEILRLRSETLHRAYLNGVLWSAEKFESSRVIVITASKLLAHLKLPKDTTMAYMLACGCDFRCLRCSPRSGQRSMTWADLVHHFIWQLETFEDLCQRNKERKLDVPLRNDHDLATEVDGTMVSRASRTTVDMAPTGENADRYSALASSWGKSTSYDMVMQATDDPRESEGESELTTENYGTFYCHLCKKLGR